MPLMNLQRIRESLALILLGLLPFHALLVTVGTKLIAGSGQAPLTELALWKEALLLLLLFISTWGIVKWKMENGKWKMQFDVLDLFIVALLLLSIVVTCLTHADWKLYAFGFKYDFIPLVAFVILRRVEWSSVFLRRVFQVILTSAAAVSVYAVLSLYLSPDWFSWLGYSDLHSLYSPDGPVAAYQQIEGVPIRRAQSTFSGPNQMGLWLLLPLSIALLYMQPVIGVLVLVALFLSMSRAAVLATLVISALFLWKRYSRRAMLALSAGGFVVGLLVLLLAPEVVSRATSSSGHIERPLQAIRTIVAHPLGLGLGTAGPANNRISDTCVHLPEGADASWAADRPSLCVFTGNVQVQPEVPCNCPVLPENWYLQIGVELGVIGLVLYLVFTTLVIVRMWNHKELFLPFLGISIAALFLHAWEDAAVAYSLWILAAVVVQSKRKP